jgi:hypothetical protein
VLAQTPVPAYNVDFPAVYRIDGLAFDHPAFGSHDFQKHVAKGHGISQVIQS